MATWCSKRHSIIKGKGQKLTSDIKWPHLQQKSENLEDQHKWDF